jgi:hypothetical protein
LGQLEAVAGCAQVGTCARFGNGSLIRVHLGQEQSSVGCSASKRFTASDKPRYSVELTKPTRSRPARPSVLSRVAGFRMLRYPFAPGATQPDA